MPNRRAIENLLVEDNPADARMLREVLKEVPDCSFGLAHVEQRGEALEHLLSALSEVARWA